MIWTHRIILDYPRREFRLHIDRELLLYGESDATFYANKEWRNLASIPWVRVFVASWMKEALRSQYSEIAWVVSKQPMLWDILNSFPALMVDITISIASINLEPPTNTPEGAKKCINGGPRKFNSEKLRQNGLETQSPNHSCRVVMLREPRSVQIVLWPTRVFSTATCCEKTGPRCDKWWQGWCRHITMDKDHGIGGFANLSSMS